MSFEQGRHQALFFFGGLPLKVSSPANAWVGSIADQQIPQCATEATHTPLEDVPSAAVRVGRRNVRNGSRVTFLFSS